jgi:hypothetical protein
MVAASPPDVVLLDLRMSGIDGHTFLRRLEALGATLPVVVMSGTGTMEDVVDVLRAGAVDFIHKPWTRDELAGALSRALRRRVTQDDPPSDATPALPGNFAGLLQDFDPETLATDPAVIIGVWADFTIGYYNPAYLRFAADNGAPDIAARHGLGGSMLDALPAEVKDYYLGHLRGVLASGLPWEHDYSCDSPSLERSYRLIARPLGGKGLLLVHSLRMLAARDQVGKQLVGEDYRQWDGKLVQCCHCRRLRHATNPLLWDFVPAALSAAVQQDFSYGLCHPCQAFYYSS